MRKKILYNLLLIAFILFLAGAEISAQQVVEEIIAKVNDTVITKRELDKNAAPIIAEIYSKYQGEERIEQIKQAKASLLENMIDGALLNYQAKIYGLTVSEAQIKAALDKIKQDNNITSDEEFERQLAMQGQTLEKLKDNIKRFSLQQQLLAQVVAPKIIITETELLHYYNKNIEDYTTPEEIRISQLLFPFGEKSADVLKEEVIEIRSQINDANDFINMVRKYSENPEEQQDGDLGYFKRNELFAELEEVAFAMEVGEISPIIETSRGFYIVHVTDKKPATKIPFEQIKTKIHNTMYAQKGSEKMKEYLKELRETNYVEILRPIK